MVSLASVSRITASLFSGAQDITLAIANLTFDFSLINVEAPPEYQGLGKCLSKKRKLDAENGRTHVTARQLGALFADDLPSTPNLSTAYGRRVSEIVASPKLQPRGSEPNGPLGDFIGADGTSIWAAATSGRGAMAAHLLACLLAKLWQPSEATAIWSELVAARQAILQERLQQEYSPINLLTSSRIEVTEGNLAEWDASARSVSSTKILFPILCMPSSLFPSPIKQYQMPEGLSFPIICLRVPILK